MRIGIVSLVSILVLSACGGGESDSGGRSEANRKDECVVENRLDDVTIKVSNGCDFKVNLYAEYSSRDYRITLPVEGANFIPGDLGAYTLVACEHPNHPRKVDGRYLC
ncbi:hypothetical protein OAS86_05455 [Gammaproteobacteria bacterium]|nr:hypothetical protein [Gammaproteobacteria bacterium]